MKTSVIGYPRIGKNRELKFASEKFFGQPSNQNTVHRKQNGGTDIDDKHVFCQDLEQ